MKRLSIIFALLSLLFLGIGCNSLLIGDIEPNTVLNNYDVFAQDYQEKYGLFKARGINWDSIVQVYRAPVEANPSEAELYLALTGLITELDDSHIYLYDPSKQFAFFSGGISGRLERQGFEDTDVTLILDSYLTLIDSVNRIIYYGTLEDNIGYIYLPQIYDVPSFFTDYMPTLIENLRDTKGLIIDIRNNNGGEDESSKAFASYFTSERKAYMISRYKIGPEPNDFEEGRTWYVEPAAGETYTKPVVLLTNRYSISAAETLSFALKTQAHVTQVGDTTTGAFSDVVSRELPNAWLYGISVGDYRNAEDMSLEGIGIAPDVLVENSAQDLVNRQDRMLEDGLAEFQ